MGAGAAGLAAAWDLAKKGWQVDLYESPGGPSETLAAYGRSCPPEILESEFKDLAALGAKRLETPPMGSGLIQDLLQNHEAVFIDCLALDPAKLGIDTQVADFATLRLGTEPLFAAACRAPGETPRFIDDLCQGRRAATSMDRLLRGVSLVAERKGEGPQPTRLETDASRIEPAAPLAPSDPKGGYSLEEAASEAARCIRCDCMQCVRRCVYMQEYRAYPKSYARQAYNNEAIVKGSRDANSSDQFVQPVRPVRPNLPS